MPYFSPLRYPGGKRQLARFVGLIVRANDLMGVEYVEPYAGGASVALDLLLNEYASRVHINDADAAVHSFWWAVLNDADSLCARIQSTDVRIEEWHAQRAILNAFDSGVEIDRMDLAFATFFLNRTNRSGILRGGVIGGKEQAGEWKLHVRFNKEELITRIRRINRQRRKIKLHGEDAVKLVDGLSPELSDKSLVYFDPPYYEKGQELYQNAYGPEDHGDVRDCVARLNSPWIVSYDDVAEVDTLYDGYASKRYGLRYTAQAKYTGSEIIFFSHGLVVPETDNPSKIPLRDYRQLEMQYL